MELAVSAYTVPTDAPESDGMFEWDATTLVVVEADVLQADVTRCGGITGFLQADALCFAHAIPLSARSRPRTARSAPTPSAPVTGWRSIGAKPTASASPSSSGARGR